MNQAGIDLIKHFESLHDGDLTLIGLQPKMCPAQIWTSGYGHALMSADGTRFLKGSADKNEAYRIAKDDLRLNNEHDAENLLRADLVKFEESVLRLTRGVDLNENQLAALVSFAYNCGTANLNVSTLLKRILAKDFKSAADEFLKWDKATVNGKKVALKGLTLRRAAERELFLKEI